MYRELNLATRPYAYYPFDSATADDLMANAGSAGTSASNMAAATPTYFQSIVPGYLAASGASVDIPASFGIGGRESQSFSVDLWFDYQSAPNHATSTYIAKVDGGGFQLIAGPSGLYVEFRAVDAELTFSLQTPIFDPLETHHVALIWTPGAAKLYFDGEFIDESSVPGGFVFYGSNNDMSFGPNVGHVTIYDRAITEADIQFKYSLKDYITSHREGCMLDGAEFFDMTITPEQYTDVVLEEELASEGSIGQAEDQFGNLAPKQTPKLVAESTYYTVSAQGLIGQGTWVICIETISGSRATDEYLFSIVNAAESMEAYLTSANVLKINKNVYNADGTTTTTTYTYDTAVTASGSKVFVMDSNRLYVKTGSTGTTLNTVSAASSIDFVFDVNNASVIRFKGSADGAGAPIATATGFYTHNSLIDPAITGGNYNTYLDPYYATGYWPGTGAYGLNPSPKQRLECAPYIPTDDTVACAYLVSQKSYGSEITMTTDIGSYATRAPISPVPTSVIPFASVPGTGFAKQLTSFVVDQETACTLQRTHYSGIKSSTIRLFSTRKTYSGDGQAYIDFTGSGSMWLADRIRNSTSHNPYAGARFDTGTVGGVVVDPSVDGSTILYTYRAFETLVYLDSSSSGTIISFNDGSTEYYMRVSGTSWSTNMSNVKINNDAAASGKSLASLRNQWIHVYMELPSTVNNHQVYIGKSSTNTDYATSLGIRNVALYPRVLTATEIDEHYQSFVGRYLLDTGAIDTLSIDEVEVPLLTSVDWASSTVAA
jgi:hypothetical protein